MTAASGNIHPSTDASKFTSQSSSSQRPANWLLSSYTSTASSLWQLQHLALLRTTSGFLRRSSSTTATPADISLPHPGSATLPDLVTMATGGSPVGSPLDIKIQVQVNSDVVMVGGTETGSHYSLTGVVCITFPALSNEFRYSRLLKGVTLTFEGKSEYWDDEGRYTPMRLHRASYPLLPRKVLVPGHLDNGAIKLALDFDISIPGWMPPTHVTDRTATGYGLVAKAKVAWAPECTDFRAAKTISTSQYTPVAIRRHRLPVSLNGLAGNPMRKRRIHSSRLGFDVDIRSREWYDLYSPEGIDIRLDVRSKHLPDDVKDTSDTCGTLDTEISDSVPKQIRRLLSKRASCPSLIELGMHINETSMIRSTPSNTFTSSFPLPEQPRSQHELYGPSLAPNIPVCNLKPIRTPHTRNCSLGSNREQMSKSFSKDELPITSSWRTVNVMLSPGTDGGQPQSDMSASFIRITHTLSIRLTFRMGNGRIESEWLEVPIRLGTCPRTAFEPVKAPPPYVSVFFENGELRDCDTLPLYQKVPDMPALSPCPPEFPLEVVPSHSPISAAPTTREADVDETAEPLAPPTGVDLSSTSSKAVDHWTG